ncbi:MAG TPA: hypothetical protein VGO61_17900 [Steroidobacteraceae bacterium]|jgi:hypothetical protein|nr:hypothetical protein [Steroidobacteraceae bacterium]
MKTKSYGTRSAIALLMTFAWSAATAADVEAECAANVQQSAYVNCACLAGKVKARQAAAPTQPWQNIVPEVAALCPADKPTISNYVFTACDSYYKTERTDHEAFCRCTSDKAADAYIAKPVFNLRYMENLRRVSMQSCGIADNSHRIDHNAAAAAAEASKPVAVNHAAANCVQWKSNDAALARNSKPSADGRVTGDLILVNACQGAVWLVRPAADVLEIADVPLDQCIAEQMPPGDQKVLRSMSTATRPGVTTKIPRARPFVCAGQAANQSDGTSETACACAPGVATVPMP